MQALIRKNKINLSDYHYKRDIENRILLAQLSVFEVNVLKEIVHHSLTISVAGLAEALEVPVQQLIPTLDKLSQTKLFKQERSTLFVDKEMRKYYESQLEKFDDDFKPGMEFLQGLLNKVPINVLPVWYAIPRGADHIFSSLVEKYLLTPTIYLQYLQELQFDDPIVKHIIDDLYKAPDFKLDATLVIQKYKLTREKFEEYILLLEYHFVGCIKYEQDNQQWKEYVSPFQEWLEYLEFEADAKLVPIQNKEEIKLMASEHEFGFILDMKDILQKCKQKPITKASLMKQLDYSQAYMERLFFKLKQVEFIQENASTIEITASGIDWLKRSLPEQSSLLAAHPLNALQCLTSTQTSLFYNPRNSRLIEQMLLKKIALHDWVYLDNFMKGFTAPIGENEGIFLKNKGKRWRYALPAYTDEEIQFIQSMIIERLFEIGFVSLGTINDKLCFTLTAFGRVTLH